MPIRLTLLILAVLAGCLAGAAAVAADYPYLPMEDFAKLGQGKTVSSFPGHAAVDYLGRPTGSGSGPGIGHIQFGGEK